MRKLKDAQFSLCLKIYSQHTSLVVLLLYQEGERVSVSKEGDKISSFHLGNKFFWGEGTNSQLRGAMPSFVPFSDARPVAKPWQSGHYPS